MGLTGALGGELEDLSKVVVAVRVLRADPRQVDCGGAEVGEGVAAGVELAVEVDGLELGVGPLEVGLGLVLDAEVRDGRGGDARPLEGVAVVVGALGVRLEGHVAGLAWNGGQ